MGKYYTLRYQFTKNKFFTRKFFQHPQNQLTFFICCLLMMLDYNMNVIEMECLNQKEIDFWKFD